LEKQYRSGFVAILGRPNVGKSTLLNALVGEKIAIVSHKPQTTRNTIQGVLTGEGFQIVFLDTPGIHQPKNKLGEYMVKTAWRSLDEVEAILMLVDAAAGIGEGDRALFQSLQNRKAPLILAVNKMDAANEDTAKAQVAHLLTLGSADEVVYISARRRKGLGELETALQKRLPEGPQYFPEDMITDQPEQRLICEMIREKMLILLQEEVPHGIGVELMAMHERQDKPLVDIQATIFCERGSHKGIIIGKQGSMLRKIGAQARYDIEKLLGCQVNLQLWVKVRENWRNSPLALKELGYQD
jgi:GTP-binding protein Era